MHKIQQIIPYVGEEELRNLEEVINKKWITEGPFTKRVLEHIKNFTGAKYALLTNNGTLGLFLSLIGIGIDDGDEVIIPDFTFNASASSVVFAGGKPVLVDVNEYDYHINIEKIENLITSKTKAIMPVHIYGQCADIDPIISIASKYNLLVIEDAAQGYGVFYKNRHVGCLGDVGVISFFADKTITMGEGAVILTNNEEIYQKIKLLRNQGRENSGSFIHPALGMNFRVTDLQCAVGLAQMEKFNKILELKSKNFAIYKTLLSGNSNIKFMRELDYCNYVPFRCSIRVRNHERLNQYLVEKGIQSRNYFYPVHKQPCFAEFGYKNDDFPITNQISNDGLMLPVYPGLPTKDIEYICDKILQFYS
jgi:perosamine synthetase